MIDFETLPASRPQNRFITGNVSMKNSISIPNMVISKINESKMTIISLNHRLSKVKVLISSVKSNVTSW